MKKIVITFGLISGVIVSALGWTIASLCYWGFIDFDQAEIIGYTSMLIALSMVFFGIKSYRDNYSGGTITFFKGVQVGLLISLVSAVVYCFGSVGYTVANPGFQEVFVEKYTEHTVANMQADGASQPEIDKAKEDIVQMQKLLENPFIYFAIALIEILPVGIIVTFICAALLRRSEVLPPTA